MMFTNNLETLRVIMISIGQVLNVDLVINLVTKLVIINLLVNY
jgi:hypothetical protein